MSIDVHHYHHGAEPCPDRFEAKLDALLAAMENLRMAIDAKTQAVLDRIDAATTAIGNAIVGVTEDLRRIVTEGGGLSDEATAEFEARLTTLEAHGQSLVALDAENVPDV